jgi:hypothetical protein
MKKDYQKEMWHYDKGGNENTGNILKIVVPSEEDKQQLLKAFQYLHDLRNIDTGYCMINLLTHFTNIPERIEVQAIL